VWLYHVYSLSLRDVELILAERGVLVTHESIRHWCLKFGADFARRESVTGWRHVTCAAYDSSPRRGW